jgi:hypothetical protein
VTNQRIQAIQKMYESGSTLREVGAAFGVSGQRIQQLLAANNIERRKSGRKIEIDWYVRHQAARDYLAGKSRSTIAEEQELSGAMVEKIIREELSRDQIAERNRKWAVKRRRDSEWSDHELVTALQHCAADLGPKFGVRRYSEWRSEQEQSYPSAPLFHTRRSWNEWRGLAGLPTAIQPKGMGAVRFTDHAIQGALARVEQECGHFPSLREYDAYRSANEPTAAAIRRRHLNRWGAVRDWYSGWKGVTNESHNETPNAGATSIG